VTSAAPISNSSKRSAGWPGTVERELERARALSLASAAARGDLGATSQVVVLVRPAVVRTVAEILGSEHPDVDDTVQQSLIALIDALGVFRGECHPAGYACRIAARIALRTRRRARRYLKRQRDLALFVGDEVAAPSAEGPHVERRRAALRELLAEIPREQAEALAQRAVLGLTLAEVARQSGAPFNTVRSRIRMAREALQSRLRARPALLEELSQI
jgi:RNA polymerase sigma-70 factor (ECF subfamily)